MGLESVLEELSRNQSASQDKMIVAVMQPYYPACVLVKEHGVCLQHAGLCSCSQGRILLDEMCIVLSNGS